MNRRPGIFQILRVHFSPERCDSRLEGLVIGRHELSSLVLKYRHRKITVCMHKHTACSQSIQWTAPTP